MDKDEIKEAVRLGDYNKVLEFDQLKVSILLKLASGDVTRLRHLYFLN